MFRETKERRRKTVHLSAELVALLKAHKEAQEAEREAAANIWEDYGAGVRPDERVAHRLPQGLGGVVWHPPGAGLPHLGVHAMRHSAATIALSEGIPLAVVQEMLSHSDIRVTRAYSHVPSVLAADAAAKMGAALLG